MAVRTSSGGQFGAWTPIGARRRQAATRLPGKIRAPVSTRCGAPTAAATTSPTSSPYGSGPAPRWNQFETSFHQDLNGDGAIGLPPMPTTVIESTGATSLTEIGSNFYLYDKHRRGPSLKYGGADYVAGQFGAWTPIGAEKTASGYEVAWQNTSTGQYTVWSTDSSGNYVSNIVAVGSGPALRWNQLRPAFTRT